MFDELRALEAQLQGLLEAEPASMNDMFCQAQRSTTAARGAAPGRATRPRG
jgi:hypothetical protein